MSQDVLGYSSHDWRKNTDDAVVIEDYNVVARVNKSKVRFTNPKTLKTEEVDLSRLIRVFVNNFESHKRSVKYWRCCFYLCLLYWQVWLLLMLVKYIFT